MGIPPTMRVLFTTTLLFSCMITSSVGHSTTHIANASNEPIRVTVNGGTATIPRGGFLGFPASGTVRISIWSDSLGYIWRDVVQNEDISFIVKDHGSVRKAKHGTIWQEH